MGCAAGWTMQNNGQSPAPCTETITEPVHFLLVGLFGFYLWEREWVALQCLTAFLSVSLGSQLRAAHPASASCWPGLFLRGSPAHCTCWGSSSRSALLHCTPSFLPFCQSFFCVCYSACRCLKSYLSKTSQFSSCQKS